MVPDEFGPGTRSTGVWGKVRLSRSRTLRVSERAKRVREKWGGGGCVGHTFLPLTDLRETAVPSLSWFRLHIWADVHLRGTWPRGALLAIPRAVAREISAHILDFRWFRSVLV
jgi:hypothetical protein